MTTKPPAFNASSFDCPHCGAYAHMVWLRLYSRNGGGFAPIDIVMSRCSHCNSPAYWLGTAKDLNGNFTNGRMLHPSSTTAPFPHPQMPVDVKLDFEEAREVAQHSPRAAAALLRLCVQKLCVHLGEPGRRVNDDIGALVRKGLPEQIQQALDVVRVVGNNAVHPGQMSSDDVAGVCDSLFGLVNYIVEDRIARPAKVRGLYEAIPQSLRDEISRRDGNPEDSTA